MAGFWEALGDSALNLGASLIGMDRQKDANKDMMNWQNTNTIEMWKMNNEYNTPANQMARLAAAGINPNLAFSNGGLSNVSISSPNADSSSVSAPHMPDVSIFAKALQNEQAKNNIENVTQFNNLIKQQTEVAEQEANLKNQQRLESLARTFGFNADNYVKHNIRKYLVDQAKYQSEAAKYLPQRELAKIHHDVANTWLTEASAVLKDQELVNLHRQGKKLLSEINLLNEQAKKEKVHNLLRNSGLEPGDPLYTRMLNGIVDDPELLRQLIISYEGVSGVVNMIGDYLFDDVTETRKHGSSSTRTTSKVFKLKPTLR